MKWPGATLLILLALGLVPAASADSRSPAVRAVDDANVARAVGERGDEEATGATPRAARFAPLASTRGRTHVLAERLSPDLDLRAELRLTLPGAPSGLGTFDADFDLDRPFAFRMPELPPESLSLRLPLGQVAVAYVWADLSDGLPRLDAVDGDTYFTPGVEVPLGTLGLRAFVEDFQPASGVVGVEDPDEPPPVRSWDGHQVALGLRWEPVDGVTVEAATVAYVLSATYREPGLGGYLSISIRY